MKRAALLGLALFAVLCKAPAGAQQTGKTFRVGILTPRSPASDRVYLSAFLRAMSGRGYVEGTNLEIVYRGAGGYPQRLPRLAADLVRTKPDAIVASGNVSIASAQHTTATIPIVMAGNGDPVASKFIASLARPGGNITGTTSMEAQMYAKRLQLLKELVPNLRRVAVVRNPSSPVNLIGWRNAAEAARSLGMVAVPLDVNTPDQIEPTFKTLPRLHVDAMLMLANGVIAESPARVVQLVAAQRLPAAYWDSSFTTAGGLLFYGVSQTAEWVQAASYLERIFKGAEPADLPVENPTTFDLTINLKTARALGLTVPQSILLRANQVIK